MQSDFWKEPLLKLTLDELRNAQAFIAELIHTQETLQKSQTDPVIVFPSQQSGKAGEQRKDKRFDIKIDGVYSVVKRDIPEGTGETPMYINDVSRHGIRFVTQQPLLPSTIVILKFYLSPVNQNEQLYKNPQKKIYAEIRRVVEIPSQTGVKYEVGALAIDNLRVEEVLKEEESRNLVNKRMAMKGDVKIMIVSVRESQLKHLEVTLLKQNYVVFKASLKQQAIALLRKTKCNIIVSDMDTARINDYELIEDIKEEFPDTRILVEIDTIEDWLAIAPLGVDDYLTKNFNDREFNIILESLYKKILYKGIFGDYFGIRRNRPQNILVVSGNDALRKLFCDVAREKDLKIYFVTNTEYAIIVLKRFKVDLIFVDTEITDLKGCYFVMYARKHFPCVSTVVASQNLNERCDFLISGADEFLVEPIDMQKITHLLG